MSKSKPRCNNLYLHEYMANKGSCLGSFLVRSSLCVYYSWAVPNNEAIRALTILAPIVEIGAGGGYWAKLLRENGVDIIAYDISPGRNDYVQHSWTEVLVGGPEKVAEHPDRSLFLCWPPYESPMAAESLEHYKGKILIYIGEDYSGCTADDRFFEILGKEFVERAEIDIPQWFGVHDVMHVYERK